MLENTLTPSERLKATIEAEKSEISKEIDRAFDNIIANAPKEPNAKLVGTETHDDVVSESENLTEIKERRDKNPLERYIIFTYQTPSGKIIRKKYSHSGKGGVWSIVLEKTIPTPPVQ